MNNRMNGRVNILNPMNNSCFTHQDNIPVSHCSDFRNAMTGNWYETNLSTAFFSDRNIQIIQNGIRAGVYKKSNGQYNIGNQNCDELKIIMRSIFLTHAVNIPTNITQQIKELNKMVINYCVPQLLGECEGYMKFKDDVSSLVVPIDRPVCTYHSNTLETKRFF